MNLSEVALARLSADRWTPRETLCNAVSRNPKQVMALLYRYQAAGHIEYSRDAGYRLVDKTRPVAEMKPEPRPAPKPEPVAAFKAADLAELGAELERIAQRIEVARAWVRKMGRTK